MRIPSVLMQDETTNTCGETGPPFSYLRLQGDNHAIIRRVTACSTIKLPPSLHTQTHPRPTAVLRTNCASPHIQPGRIAVLPHTRPTLRRARYKSMLYAQHPCKGNPAAHAHSCCFKSTALPSPAALPAWQLNVCTCMQPLCQVRQPKRATHWAHTAQHTRETGAGCLGAGCQYAGP